MKVLLFLLICFVFTNTTQGEQQKTPTYAGGMMFQTGAIKMSEKFDNMEGMFFGVGGRLYFMIKYGFRSGVMGGTGKMSYGNYNSRFQYSYNCFVFDWSKTYKRVTAAAGVAGGRGKYYILNKTDVSDNSVITAKEYENSAWIASPILSLEFSITNRLRTSTVIDYPFMNIEEHQHSGIRIGTGVLFVK